VSTPEPPEASEGTGTFAEESARLLAAFQEWAAKGRTAAKDLAETHGESSGAGHSPECAICPICQGIRLLRGARPEVVEHLSDAATSFLAALAAMLPAEGAEPARRDRETAQHIDVFDVFGDDGNDGDQVAADPPGDAGRSDGPAGAAS
jgi:hypothetical protein